MWYPCASISGVVFLLPCYFADTCNLLLSRSTFLPTECCVPASKCEYMPCPPRCFSTHIQLATCMHSNFISVIEKERLKGEKSSMVDCCVFTASMARVYSGCTQFGMTVTAVVMQPGGRQGRAGCKWGGATGYFLASLYACTKEKMLCCDYSKCPHVNCSYLYLQAVVAGQTKFRWRGMQCSL